MWTKWLFFVLVQKHQRSIRNLVGGRLECCDDFLVYSPTIFPLSLAPTYTSSTSLIQPLGVGGWGECGSWEQEYAGKQIHFSSLNLNPQPTISGEKMHMSFWVGFWAHSHTHTPTHTIRKHPVHRCPHSHSSSVSHTYTQQCGHVKNARVCIAMQAFSILHTWALSPLSR